MERRLFLGAMVAAAASRPLHAAERIATPRLTEGPYYPPRIPEDHDWDLVRTARGTAIGQVLMVEGRLLRTAGTPVAGAMVEIWQADANGRYLHPGETLGAKPRDVGFQGYGAILTDAQGRYRFRTVRPPGYRMPGGWGGGWRTPHIHFGVRRGETRVSATQMFFPGEAMNAQDSILLAAGDAGRRSLIAELGPRRADGATPARFDIVLPA